MDQAYSNEKPQLRSLHGVNNSCIDDLKAINMYLPGFIVQSKQKIQGLVKHSMNPDLLLIVMQ